MDKDWLQQIGVQGSDAELVELEAKIGSALELLVGDKIAGQLSAEQLDEVEALIAKDELVISWLETNVPGYQKVVDAETVLLREQIEASDDKVAFIEQLKS